MILDVSMLEDERGRVSYQSCESRTGTGSFLSETNGYVGVARTSYCHTMFRDDLYVKKKAGTLRQDETGRGGRLQHHIGHICHLFGRTKLANRRGRHNAIDFAKV